MSKEKVKKNEYEVAQVIPKFASYKNVSMTGIKDKNKDMLTIKIIASYILIICPPQVQKGKD